MASQKSNNKKPPSNNQAIEQEEVLQAIVILESYTNKFKPLSDDTPECLLPLLNKPLINYTLEFLKEHGVEEIHLFCSQYYEKIKKYLNESKWSLMFRSDKIQLQSIPGCTTLNESMRQINMLFSTRALARSQFILITAPSILAYSINLKEKFDLHKQRYKANKNAIMTILCSKKSTDLNLNFNTRENQTYLMLNSEMVILNYYNSYDPTEGAFSISSETMRHLNKLDSSKTSSKIYLRTDLFDTQIYFCSSHVLNLFEDNFHAQSMTAFLDTIISDTIASNVIYCDILNRTNGAYLATINSLNSYYFQTMKLLQRSREFNLASNIEYKINSLNIFLSREMVSLKRNVNFKRNVFVQSGVEIGEGSVLINCFIGKNCKLGSNVHISNCILFDNCEIGNDIRLNACLLGSNVKLGHKCKLVENILIGNNCDISENTIFSDCGIYHVPQNDGSGFSDDEDEVVNDESVCGSNYTKYRFAKGDDDEDGVETDSEHGSLVLKKNDEIKQNEIYESLKHFYVWPIKKSKVIKNSLNSSNEDCDQDDEDDDEYYEIDDDSGDESDFNKNSDSDEDPKNNYPSDSDEEHNASTVDNDEKQFELELIELLKRPIDTKSYDIANLLIEINSLKAAHFQNYENVCLLTAKQLLDLPINYQEELIRFKGLKTPSPPTYLDLIVIVVERFEDFILEYYSNQASQYILLNSILDFFFKRKFDENLLVKLLHKLNQDFELLDENIIVRWYDDSLKNDNEGKWRLLNNDKFIKFIDWLKNAEEDDDDEDD